jgi:hypothetical protein
MTAPHAVLGLVSLLGLGLLTIHLQQRRVSLQRLDVIPGSTGEVSSSWTEIMTTLLGGENISLDQHPWDQEIFRTSREDLSIVLNACLKGILSMERFGNPPAPYPWERAAILFNRAGLHQQELAICSFYIQLLDEFYACQNGRRHADIRRSRRYQRITQRAHRARQRSLIEVISGSSGTAAAPPHLGPSRG